VCGFDRAEKALRPAVQGFWQKQTYVFYVRLNFGLGEFFYFRGVADFNLFAKVRGILRKGIGNEKKRFRKQAMWYFEKDSAGRCLAIAKKIERYFVALCGNCKKPFFVVIEILNYIDSRKQDRQNTMTPEMIFRSCIVKY